MKIATENSMNKSSNAMMEFRKSCGIHTESPGVLYGDPKRLRTHRNACLWTSACGRSSDANYLYAQ